MQVAMLKTNDHIKYMSLRKARILYTSKCTNSSARLTLLATCQNILHACVQPEPEFDAAELNENDSKSVPPFGRMIIAYVWRLLK